jgi:hypothetical protein
MYINKILSQRNTDNIEGIQKTRNKVENLLFADDQTIIAGTEPLMTMSAHKLENII